MIHWAQQPDIVLLGGGKADPRVAAVNVDSGETWRLLELPPLHSVYAVDLDPKNGNIAVGTKGISAKLVYLTFE